MENVHFRSSPKINLLNFFWVYTINKIIKIITDIFPKYSSERKYKTEKGFCFISQKIWYTTELLRSRRAFLFLALVQNVLTGTPRCQFRLNEPQLLFSLAQLLRTWYLKVRSWLAWRVSGWSLQYKDKIKTDLFHSRPVHLF